MATTHDIHNDIESWLAAAVHDQLSPEERAQFNEHLASCTDCRALYEEELTMSRMIEATLEEVKPDLAFEQRIVSGFRKTVPQRTGFVPLLVSLFRLRATQITAVAAVLLTLVQVGKMVTGESAAPRSRGEVAETSSFKDSRMHPDVSEAQSAAPPPVAAKPVAPQPQSYATADTASAASGLRRDNALAAKKAETRAAKTQAAVAEPAQDAETPATPAETVAVDEVQTNAPAGVDANRKLVRNAQVELEVIKFDDAVQKITAFAGEDKGYIATSSSERQANGKLRGEVVVKVLPDHLDGFLLKLRGLGDVKNQTLGTEDVTKQYFDTDARLKNARVMEQRLVDILKTKSTKVADLLEVEKELGRVREQIETMQGELKYMEVQVAFATVTITLAEKEMNVPAAFLLKRRATLSLFSTDVEKTFGEMKSVIDGAKAQISSSTLDRDSSGEATARLTLLIVAEEADTLIDRIKGMGRVQNYNEQTDRIAQGGTGMGENAKVERDKVQLSITISRNEQEPALQSTSLRILTSSVGDKVARLKENAAKSGAEIRSSSFTRNPDGQEVGNLTLRVAMKNYAALMSSFDQLGKVKDVSVQRDDRRGAINEETAPADISIQVYSQPNIVADETGLFATIRRTLAQGASALMWSLRMIGVALAFFAPWIVALVIVIWVAKRISRARAARRAQRDTAE
ncbi:MAG: DUF4349 domain-containing protein [Chthoniobacterales bacterium]